MAKYIHKFRIDRSKWSYGGADQTALLNDKGFMCCLGFLAVSCGVPKRNMLHLGYPRNLIGRGANKTIKLMNGHNQDAFVDVNDNGSIANRKRETKLTRMFADNGVRVSFYGKYPKPPEK